MRANRPRGAGGFTLVELLVVIGIVMILAGLLLPVMSGAVARAKVAQCMGNLRQVGMAAVMYGDDHNDALPRSAHEGQSWVETLQPYCGGTNLWRCPEDRNRGRGNSYGLNDFLLPQRYERRTQVPSTAETMLMGECRESYERDHFHFAGPEHGSYEVASFRGQVAVSRHRGGAQYLFVDGHVERWNWGRTQARLVEPGSRFIDPAGHRR
jgi:prepilin-type processing-associated H-X9-DG protein